MMRLPWKSPLAVWAARDLMRRPGETLLLFSALSAVVALLALVLLVEQTVSNTCRRLMAHAPAMVVRRIDAGGWAPIPAESLSRIQSVPGVLRPRARVWGVVGGPTGPVTIVGACAPASGQADDALKTLPAEGQAWIGPGVIPSPDPLRLALTGRKQMDLAVIGRLPENSGMAVHDVVVLHAADARRLLGLNAGQASDVALDVFHEEEVEALAVDLAAALDWPVQITTRGAQLERRLNDISRRTGMILFGFIPALLALLLIVGGTGAANGKQRRDIGLLKALGWTGGELIRLQVYRGLLVALPGLAVGMAAAYGLLFHPGSSWLLQWLFDWNGPAPQCRLSAQGAAGGLVTSVLLTGVPFMAAVFWTGRRAAVVDPSDGIEGDP